MGGLFKRGGSIVSRSEMLSEFQINSATYGEVVPVVLGTTRISGNIIDYLDFTAHEHRSSQRVGKGGGKKAVSITYTYTVAVAIGLCEGPIQGIGKVWKNKDILTYPSDELGLTLFKGDYGQEPWSYTKEKHPEKALPYSGLAYMAGVLDLGDRASMPQLNFEVKGFLLDTGDGVDVNPADYILYILTDPTNGVGFSTNDIDMESLNNARKYWKAADLLISSPKDNKSKNARDIVNKICELTGVYVFWSQNRLKFVPVCMDEISHEGTVYTPNKTVLYDLTSEDFIPQSNGALVKFERSDTSKAYNQANVEFVNRANSYELETVSFDVQNDVLRRGLRPASKVQAEFIYTKKRALFIAEMLAKKYIYQRNTYSFKLDWAFSRLEPGDLVSLTDEQSGLDKRVVIIMQIKENVDGCVDVTAVSVPDGVYSSATMNVHEAERPFVDRTVAPSKINHVALFQPSGSITEKGLEVWGGVTADGNHWGGCEVYASDNNETYSQVGTISLQSRIGELVDDIGEDDTTMSVMLYHGELLSGTSLDAERGNTQLFVDGELISYTTATLISQGQYRLEGCIRGQGGTTKAGHGRKTTVVRLDDTLMKKAFTEDDIGRKMYFKFASFNEFGASLEDLADVEPVSYTIKSYYIPQVQSLNAFPRYRKESGAKVNYDVIVEVVPPQLKSYEKTGIFYKIDNAREWQFAGFTAGKDGNARIVIPQATLGEVYTIKAIVYDKHGYTSDEDMARTERVEIIAKQEVPNVPEHFSIAFSDKCDLSWDDVTNADVDFYEVRTNENAGTQGGLLAKVNTNGASIALSNRKGKLYLFAHSRMGQYSYPASLVYNKEVPPMPVNVKYIPILQGFTVEVPPIPANCKGMNVYIDGETYFTTSRQFTYHGEAGQKDVRVAYVDSFGEGQRTYGELVEIKVTIDGRLIERNSLSMDMMDDTITQAIHNASNLDGIREEVRREITSVKQYVSDGTNGMQAQITSVIQSLNVDDPKKSAYSAISQLANGLELRVKEDELISKINMSPAGTTIDGKVIRITGDTQFEKGVLAKQIDAGSITADKLAAGAIKAESLSAITSKIGLLRTKDVGARTEISDNLIQVFDEEGRLRVRMGVWS